MATKLTKKQEQEIVNLRKKRLIKAIFNAWTEVYEDDWEDGLENLKEIYLNGYNYKGLNSMTVEELENLIKSKDEELLCTCTDKGTDENGNCDWCAQPKTIDEFLEMWAAV